MKRVVDLLGAFLTALTLCILPARADVIAGPMIAVGLIGRLRAKRKDEEEK